MLLIDSLVDLVYSDCAYVCLHPELMVCAHAGGVPCTGCGHSGVRGVQQTGVAGIRYTGALFTLFKHQVLVKYSSAKPSCDVGAQETQPTLVLKNPTNSQSQSTALKGEQTSTAVAISQDGKHLFVARGHPAPNLQVYCCKSVRITLCFSHIT